MLCMNMITHLSIVGSISDSNRQNVYLSECLDWFRPFFCCQVASWGENSPMANGLAYHGRWSAVSNGVFPHCHKPSTSITLLSR